jgi:hypothetical protein
LSFSDYEYMCWNSKSVLWVKFILRKGGLWNFKVTTLKTFIYKYLYESKYKLKILLYFYNIILTKTIINKYIIICI